MEGFEHQQGVLQFRAGLLGVLFILQQSDQGLYVVAAVHIAQQVDCHAAVDQAALGLALGDGREKAGLDVGGFIHTRGHAIGYQVQQVLFLACGWGL